MTAAGVPRAMSRVLEAYNKDKAALKRYLRRFVGRSEDIEDIAQEAFLRAFAAESVKEIQSPKAFLFKVARNVALDEKAKQSHVAMMPLEDFGDTTVLDSSIQVSVEDEVESRRRLFVLAQAVADLPPQCARCFLMRKVYGLSYKEIATRLEISESTVEKHVALGALRCINHLRAKGYTPSEQSPKPSGKGRGASTFSPRGKP